MICSLRANAKAAGAMQVDVASGGAVGLPGCLNLRFMGKALMAVAAKRQYAVLNESLPFNSKHDESLVAHMRSPCRLAMSLQHNPALPVFESHIPIPKGDIGQTHFVPSPEAAARQPTRETNTGALGKARRQHFDLLIYLSDADAVQRREIEGWVRSRNVRR